MGEIMTGQTKIPAKLESIVMVKEFDEHADNSYYGEHLFREEGDCINISEYRHVERNQAQYFRSDYYPYKEIDWNHVSKEAKQKVIDEYNSLENACLQYALQDYDRLQDLYDGGWHYEYLCAKAFITLNPDESGHQTTITISSDGRGGIESDIGDDYFQEIYQEEIQILSHTLRSFGFTQEQIDAAVVRDD